MDSFHRDSKLFWVIETPRFGETFDFTFFTPSIDFKRPDVRISANSIITLIHNTHWLSPIFGNIFLSTPKEPEATPLYKQYTIVNYVSRVVTTGKHGIEIYKCTWIVEISLSPKQLFSRYKTHSENLGYYDFKNSMVANRVLGLPKHQFFQTKTKHSFFI